MITIDPIKRPPRKSSAIDKDELMKEVDQKFLDLIDGAPEKLDTIKELADAVGNISEGSHVTEETVTDWGFTKNQGTIGAVDLGTDIDEPDLGYVTNEAFAEIGDKIEELKTEYIYLDAPLSGSIKKSSYTPEFTEAVKWIKRVEYKNVVDYGKLVSAYISYISIAYNNGKYGMEVNYDKKYYFKGFNSTDVGKENILSFIFDDGSGIDVVIERPYVGDSSYNKNADVRNERIGFVQTEKKDEKIKLSSPFFGEIPIKDYNINIHHAISSILSVKYVNVVDFDKLKELYINYVGFADDTGSAKRINVELVYDSKPYIKGITYVSMDGYSPLSYEFDDGTVIELLLRYPREGLVAFVDIRNYKIRLTQDSFKNGVLEGNNDVPSDSDNTNNNGCSLSLITNAIGNPVSRNFRDDNSSKTPVNQVVAYHDGFYNLKFTRNGAGTAGIWNALRVDLKANHKYILISKYRYNSNARFNNRLTYYITALGFVLNGSLRCDNESDFGYWKYSLNNGNNIFVAAEDKTYTLDVVFNFNDTETANEVILDIDLCPILIDITDVDINSFGLISIFEKYGVVFDSMAIANVGLNPVNSIVRENMVCLGDSTTGMMMWQDKLAKIKGWEWDCRTNGGIEINGIQRAAMGVGSTWVEPIITGTTGGGKGQSHYMRAKDAKYYNPSVFFVMSSYNGAHAGGHWAGNENFPKQKEDYGLDDAPYKGEEIDLTVNPNAEVPSFGASYYGMIEQLIEDLPNTQIVLLNLCTDFAGANIESIEKKNAVIKKAAETYNLLMLDVNKEAGFNKINRYVMRYQGGVHFNDAGGMRLAKFIASKL